MSSKSLTRALVILSGIGLSVLAIMMIWQILQPTESTGNQPVVQPVPIANLGPMPVASTPTAPPAASGYEHFQKGEWDEAIRDLTEAIRQDPKDTASLINRAMVYAALGNWDKAIADFGTAIALEPDNTRWLATRAQLRSLKGDFDGVIADLTEVIRLQPGEATGYANRGFAWFRKGDAQKALADLNEALRLKPDDAGALNNLAWVLATCADDSIRDGKRAVTVATRACELTQWTDWHTVGTLAAANAEAGDFEAAVKFQKQAMGLPGIADKDREEMEQRLALFVLRKPAREEPKR